VGRGRFILAFSLFGRGQNLLLRGRTKIEAFLLLKSVAIPRL
jgi:hypothetical protein